MALIAHTAPAVNIPSKKIANTGFIPKVVDMPPKQTEKKNPTHVDVHNIQLIKPEMNLPKPLKGRYSFEPQEWILLLKLSKIEP